MIAKISLLASAILLAAILALSALYLRSHSETIDALQLQRLEAIAVTAASSFSQADLALENEDVFRSLQIRLEAIAAANGIEPQLVYLVRPNALEVLLTGDPMHNDAPNQLQRPPNRATARITNVRGETIALLEVGAWNSTFANQRPLPWGTLVIAALCALAGAILIFWTVNRSTKKLRELAAITEAISRGELERAIPEVEVGPLSPAIERLRESVRTGIELLSSSRAR